MATDNSTCTLEYYLKPRSEALLGYSLAHVVLGATIIFVSISLWFYNRRSVYLKRRHGTMIMLVSIGMMLNLVTGPGGRYLGVNANCHLDFFCFYMVLPLVSWPLVIRMLIWVNQVKFNYKIAAKLADEGLMEVNTHSPELKYARIAASKTFGVVLALSFLLPFSIVVFFVAQNICSTCVDDTLSTLLLFGFIMLFVILSVVIALYKNRDVPDPTNLRRETKISFAIAAAIGFPTLVLDFLDVGGYDSASSLAFQWGILQDWGILLFYISVVTVPVYKSFHTNTKAPSTGNRDGLAELLKTTRGLKFFELYLATELSIENLMFYQSVKNWKKLFKSDTLESVVHGRRIFDTYLNSDAYLAINVPDSIRGEVMQEFGENAMYVAGDIFDKATEEVFALMSSYSYPNFKKSDFYKLYTSEVEPEAADIVTSSGLTTYSSLSRAATNSEMQMKSSQKSRSVAGRSV